MTRRALALACLALAALVLQSAAASLVPVAMVPDFALLVAVGVAVCASPGLGLLVAAGVGFGADLLSEALLGHHALLRIGAFALTRGTSAQFHLQRGLPLAAFVAVLTLLDALGSSGLHWLFYGDLLIDPRAAGSLLLRAAVNALFAPLVRATIRFVLELTVERDARRRDVRLETRRPVL